MGKREKIQFFEKIKVFEKKFWLRYQCRNWTLLLVPDTETGFRLHTNQVFGKVFEQVEEVQVHFVLFHSLRQILF